jgi:hypothetical protein
MKVVDWKAAFEALVQYVSPIEVAAGLVEDLVTKHTREVPEGLATRLLGTVEMYRTETRGRGITSEFIGEDATPEACAALDAMPARVTELEGEEEASLALIAAYRAAYDALRKAGKLP